MAGTVLLTERFSFPGGGKVRRPGVDGYAGQYPVIEEVLLCGQTSLNGRDYPPSAFKERGNGRKRYENRPVFVDHHDGKGGRRYADQIGWVTNERRRADGMPVGDIALKPTHALTETVLFDAEHKPDNCGMSHVAKCRLGRRANGRDTVEDVDEVESVDIVVGAATTKGFFEQDTRGRAVATTFRDVCESLRPRFQADPEKAKRLRKWLLAAEDDGGMAGLMDAPAAMPADSDDPDAALWSGFQAAISAVLEQYATSGDAAAAVKQIGKYIKAHARLNTGTEAADDAEKPAEQAVATAATGAVFEQAVAESVAAKLLTQTQATTLSMLVKQPDAESRKQVIQLAREAACKAEPPVSRPRQAPKTPEPDANNKPVPADGKTFAESIR